MTDFEQTLQEIDRLCRTNKVSYAVIGGIATNIYGYVCTIEDLIIMKLVAARAKDTLDLEELIARHRSKLDLVYLRASAKEFIHVERGDIIERLEEFLRKP